MNKVLNRATNLVLAAVSALIIASSDCVAQPVDAIGIGNWLSVSSNVDAGYHRTEFFEPIHNAAVFQWDSRIEVWLPPYRDRFTWGPYVRVAGIKSSRGEAWENAWLGGPGFGFQVYPASVPQLRQPNNLGGTILGPLRLFAEYNVLDYWGSANTWRPTRQRRAGADYWKAFNVNSLTHVWWAEVWNGLFWQSTNEFTDKYNSLVAGNAARVGLRQPGATMISLISPYVALESSWTKNADFYWENHLLVGGGLRVTPSLIRSTGDNHRWVSRLVLYGEYLNTVRYYGVVPDATVPRYDFRFGISTNIGQWYR